MLETFKSRFTKEKPAPREAITTLTGLEDQLFSLPDTDADGNETGTHHDDWRVTNQRFYDSGDMTVDVARYNADGTIDAWNGIPADRFMEYQKNVEEEQKALSLELGVSAVRAALVQHVRSSDAYRENRRAEEPFWHDLAKKRGEHNERILAIRAQRGK